MQSTATSTNTVSKQEALTLVRNMIRISVSSICYIRQLFPDDCFRARNYGSIEIHQLHCGEKEEDGEIKIINEEAFLVTQWLQNGVFRALDAGYVSSLIFIVYTKHPKTKEDVILETYEFKITYPDGNQVAAINDVKLFSKESVKQQASQFIRALIDFCGTLDTIPEERWITLQIHYTNSAPKNYEPEYFEAASESLLHGKTFPLKVNIGDIKTQEMKMKLRFAGLESLFVEHEILETPLAKKPSVLLAKKHVIEDESSQSQAEPASQNLADKVSSMVIENRPMGYESLKDTKDDSYCSLTEAYVLIKDYIDAGKTVQVRACARALKLTENVVSQIYQQMFRDGILDRQKSGTKFRYNRITLIDSKESSSKSKKKRGLDEETCIDENENVEQLVSEVKSTTPKWNHILNQVQSDSNRKRPEPTKPTAQAIPTMPIPSKIPLVPASQMSTAEDVNQKISKVKEPLHLPTSKRQKRW